MNKFGIKSVSYIPLCSTEEIKLEMKKPTGNEIVKKMWDKLDDEEQGFINVMIDRDNKQNEENKRLNNIINELEKSKEKQINEYEILILKIERYLNCYQYFLESQEENNKKLANMIHEFSLGSDKE